MESSKGVSPHNSHCFLTREAKLLLKEGDKLLAITHRVGVHLVLTGDVGPLGVGRYTVSPPCSEAGLFDSCRIGLNLVIVKIKSFCRFKPVSASLCYWRAFIAL